MSRDDYDKQQWQAEQAARDAAIDKQREREKKTRERAARNAKRKLERLQKKLKETGDLTEWEDEFAGSVTERLDQFGSAFHDREKGRPGDALSFAQKRVVASLKKKAKPKKSGEKEPRYKRRSTFKSKTPKFTPRVRQLDEDFDEASPAKPTEDAEENAPARAPKKPFLRIVKSGDET